ncbi:hypothetical protein chiPu_0033246, partial [Chiloscyllium punctatum]|nr:hypothetical protein [Chiloscyllium punctatum]
MHRRAMVESSAVISRRDGAFLSAVGADLLRNVVHHHGTLEISHRRIGAILLPGAGAPRIGVQRFGLSPRVPEIDA